MKKRLILLYLQSSCWTCHCRTIQQVYEFSYTDKSWIVTLQQHSLPWFKNAAQFLYIPPVLPQMDCYLLPPLGTLVDRNLSSLQLRMSYHKSLDRWHHYIYSIEHSFLLDKWTIASATTEPRFQIPLILLVLVLLVLQEFYLFIYLPFSLLCHVKCDVCLMYHNF